MILPHQQRSWIGKAHLVDAIVKPTYYRPGALHEDTGTVHAQPLTPGDDEKEEWVLVDGTPATCAQLGIYHFFQDRGPVDLVVSGPNYGRNSTALFSLSSGTLGGAMEGALCQKKAIALSFAYSPGEHIPERIVGACKHSVNLIQYLYDHWAKDIDMYSINVPLVDDVGTHKILYTHTLQNYWTSGSSYQEVSATEDDLCPETREKEIRESEETNKDVFNSTTYHKHRNFKWAPRFSDIRLSVKNSLPGNDGWAIDEEYTRYTTSLSILTLQLTTTKCDPTQSKFYASVVSSSRRVEAVSILRILYKAAQILYFVYVFLFLQEVN